MGISTAEAVLAEARASGDDALVVAALGELGKQRLVDGHLVEALRALREAAERAGALGEGVLGRSLGDLGVALRVAGQPELAERTLLAAMAYLRRAGDLAGSADVAIKRARSLAGNAPELVETAWADAARRCAAAGFDDGELRAELAAAWFAAQRGDRTRTLYWLAALAPRLDALDGEAATWARGELGALWLYFGQPAQAVPLLERAAAEERAAGRSYAAAMRDQQLQLCRSLLLGDPDAPAP